MAFTYGFYNSFKGDRKYDAIQVSEMFDGILKDGIIPSQGQLFAVTTANNGMQINVGTGRAWFEHTWSKNDSVMVLTVPQSDITRDRWDAVVLEVNHSDDVRANAIKIESGVAAVNPTKPNLLNTDKVKQFPLAYILVKAATEEIKAEHIENAVGLTPTVFATGVLETAPLDDLWEQWKGEFNAWFSAIKLQLSGDIVTNLQRQIDEVRTTDGITCTDEVSNKLKLETGSTLSVSLLKLDTRIDNLIDSILAMGNYVRTGDYSSAGSGSHVAKGTNAIAVIIGGGGGGGRSLLESEYADLGVAGGGGGGGGALVISSDTIVKRGTAYNYVVGSAGLGGTSSRLAATAGGTSSIFSTTAAGGEPGSYPGRSWTNVGVGGTSSTSYGGNGGQGPTSNDAPTSGASATAYTKTDLNGVTWTIRGGGGGGGGGSAISYNPYTIYYYGSAGGAGSGAGGSGSSRTDTAGENGSPASFAGGGGGGGGGGCYKNGSGGHGNGGNGGNGRAGRIIVYEKGVLEA